MAGKQTPSDVVAAEAGELLFVDKVGAKDILFLRQCPAVCEAAVDLRLAVGLEQYAAAAYSVQKIRLNNKNDHGASDAGGLGWFILAYVRYRTLIEDIF